MSSKWDKFDVFFISASVFTCLFKQNIALISHFYKEMQLTNECVTLPADPVIPMTPVAPINPGGPGCPLVPGDPGDPFDPI
jgi:hypothetical protein